MLPPLSPLMSGGPSSQLPPSGAGPGSTHQQQAVDALTDLMPYLSATSLSGGDSAVDAEALAQAAK